MLVEFPMVEEARASGRVAGVYAAVSERAPFVPSLFKTLAVCPPYLVLAWEQVAPILGEPVLAQAGSRITAAAERVSTPPAEAADRRLLGQFVAPISNMLLLSCGLLAALDGDLDDRRPATGEIALPHDAPGASSVPSIGELGSDAAVLGQIRASLQTPIINSIWRRAAAEGRLEPIWRQLEPQAPHALGVAGRLRDAAADLALELPWQPVASHAALERVELGDAAPGMAVILAAYASTLPRVLALAGSSANAEPTA